MYSLTFRRRFWPFKRTIRGVRAHSYHQQTDKMWLLTATGGREIMKWSNCEVFLDSDWKDHVDQLEQERLKREAKAE